MPNERGGLPNAIHRARLPVTDWLDSDRIERPRARSAPSASVGIAKMFAVTRWGDVNCTRHISCKQRFPGLVERDESRPFRVSAACALLARNISTFSVKEKSHD